MNAAAIRETQGRLYFRGDNAAEAKPMNAAAAPEREGRLFFVVIDSLIALSLVATAVSIAVLCIAAASL
ncbi:MAG TPA: hypothetical protein VEC38_02375 [Candidatus Binataceae bacterium]|nr:hypothetical protein [Candidatus Binataceae bacterium]